MTRVNKIVGALALLLAHVPSVSAQQPTSRLAAVAAECVGLLEGFNSAGILPLDQNIRAANTALDQLLALTGGDRTGLGTKIAGSRDEGAEQARESDFEALNAVISRCNAVDPLVREFYERGRDVDLAAAHCAGIFDVVASHTAQPQRAAVLLWKKEFLTTSGIFSAEFRNGEPFDGDAFNKAQEEGRQVGTAVVTRGTTDNPEVRSCVQLLELRNRLVQAVMPDAR